MYLIRRKGFGPSDDTWQEASDFDSREFMRQQIARLLLQDPSLTPPALLEKEARNLQLEYDQQQQQQQAKERRLARNRQLRQEKHEKLICMQQKEQACSLRNVSSSSCTSPAATIASSLLPRTLRSTRNSSANALFDLQTYVEDQYQGDSTPDPPTFSASMLRAPKEIRELVMDVHTARDITSHSSSQSRLSSYPSTSRRHHAASNERAVRDNKKRTRSAEVDVGGYDEIEEEQERESDQETLDAIRAAKVGLANDGPHQAHSSLARPPEENSRRKRSRVPVVECRASAFTGESSSVDQACKVANSVGGLVHSHRVDYDKDYGFADDDELCVGSSYVAVHEKEGKKIDNVNDEEAEDGFPGMDPCGYSAVYSTQHLSRPTPSTNGDATRSWTARAEPIAPTPYSSLSLHHLDPRMPCSPATSHDWNDPDHEMEGFVDDDNGPRAGTFNATAPLTATCSTESSLILLNPSSHDQSRRLYDQEQREYQPQDDVKQQQEKERHREDSEEEHRRRASQHFPSPVSDSSPPTFQQVDHSHHVAFSSQQEYRTAFCTPLPQGLLEFCFPDGIRWGDEKPGAEMAVEEQHTYRPVKLERRENDMDLDEDEDWEGEAILRNGTDIGFRAPSSSQHLAR